MTIYCPQCQCALAGVHGDPGARDTHGCPTSKADPFLSLAPAGPSSCVCLEPETRIDRFVMRVELDRGSHGAVWLARDTVRSEDVAVKVVRVGAGRSGTAASQLSHELCAYGKITDFAHVLRVHDIFTAPWGAVELLLLSMEYADGGSWRKWLKSRNDDWQAGRSQGRLFFKQACLGVQAIHTVGEVHRDIKPDNLLLVNDVLKVADFGGSGPAHVSAMDVRRSSFENSAVGGTPVCMSPEQFNAAHPDDPDAYSNAMADALRARTSSPQRLTPATAGDSSSGPTWTTRIESAAMASSMTRVTAAAPSCCGNGSPITRASLPRSSPTSTCTLNTTSR